MFELFFELIVGLGSIKFETIYFATIRFQMLGKESKRHGDAPIVLFKAVITLHVKVKAVIFLSNFQLFLMLQTLGQNM